jgi:hypothetical protein
MFMARPHRRALAFLGFWVRQAPHDTPRIDAVVDQLALPNRVAPRADCRRSDPASSYACGDL